MHPTPPPSKSKPSIRKFLRQKADKVFNQLASPLSSKHDPQLSSGQLPSSSSLPSNQSGLAPAHLTSHTHQVIGTSQGISASAATNLQVAPAGPATASSSTNVHPATQPPAISALHSAPQATNGIWAGLRAAFRALHQNSELFPPLQSAVGTFISCLDVLEKSSKTHREYDELASELTSLAELLAQHMKQSTAMQMSQSIANIARSIEEQTKLVESKRIRGKGSRLVESVIEEEELSKHYRRIRYLFRQLQADANLSVWNIVNDQMANTRLEGLAPVKLASHDSKLSAGIGRRICTANTRTAILSGLDDWSHDPDGVNLYWMNGMAGTGKTTIACSFSEELEDRKQLAASFFCTRTFSECRDASRIIPTIAYQLARYSIPFRSVLCEALAEDPDAGSRNMMKQFEKLLKQPLPKVKEAIPNNLVVVIDALDECDDMREVELLLSILVKSVADIPLKFFVTSRPEPEIYSRMLTRVHDVNGVLHLHEVEKSLVQADIEVYLVEELEFMSPTLAQIKELAQRSGNLFIYAATLVRYIRSRKPQTDPHQRLQSVLSMTSTLTDQYVTIDGLYAAVVKAALDEDSEDLEMEEIEDVRRVLRTVICVQEPVELEVLVVLAGLSNERRALSALQPLLAVLHFSESSRLVSTLHASFPDFMFDKTRSNSLYCDLAEHSELITRRCFEVMKTQLRFNICELESSFLPDKDVINLDDRVKKAISPALSYTCHYWGNHLGHSQFSNSLWALLNEFLSSRLLFWMEVLNLKREIGLGAMILLKAKVWLKIDAAPVDAARLIEDARNFVTGFAANPVSQSTPHIYISSLSFCSKSSSLFNQYSKKTRNLINVTGTAMQSRDAAALASWNVGSMILSVAYSPDGSRVAFGCGDGVIGIRNAHDGALVAGPFKVHADWVQSIAYSPDSTHIVSGSTDETIRVWSAHDGKLTPGPFEGHTGWIQSVAYSPNGIYIASGAADMTIRVWNAHEGKPVAAPFEGHTDWVQSVAYSPDGGCIVSGSKDKTIRVWGANDGQLVAGPFEGHTGWVQSVAYSPNGTRIISGSDDKTIRVWSADGMLFSSPLKGHTGSVHAVAYSPDGTQIVSGSTDKTIRAWSAQDNTLVAGPFEGHTSQITSVTYSPCGTRIVSGSWDGTIQVWSAINSSLALGLLEAHTDSITSVAFSPDGTRIVSSSRDHTLRVWSERDGTLVAGPFEGHTDWVQSAAYSPDGTRIVSGSSDKTIRVWSAHDGKLITGPFEGHTDWVQSVAYSPDGTRIASGSIDKTIRVWNAHNGTPLSKPFEGHTDRVISVAYSPDGTRIVSGSTDETVRVWSSHDGTLLGGPFEDHLGWVNSVAYSPDGTRIVSGFSSGSIRVRNAHNGTLHGSLFERHTGPVISVAYSPDGTNIASGSFDKTVRVWGAHNGVLVSVLLKEQTGMVASVAYSPDGAYIVCSSDRTIRVCSAREGRSVTSPFQGHANSDSHLELSSDPPTSNRTHHLQVVLDHWNVRHDGWVVDNSRLLFWVPPEFANHVPTIPNGFVIGPRGTLQIDYSDSLLGEDWLGCYEQ